MKKIKKIKLNLGWEIVKTADSGAFGFATGTGLVKVTEKINEIIDVLNDIKENGLKFKLKER